MIKNRIRDNRLARGMSQEELATRLGVTKTAVSDYERGRRFPRMAILFGLTELFGCHVEDLYPREMRGE